MALCQNQERRSTAQHSDAQRVQLARGVPQGRPLFLYDFQSAVLYYPQARILHGFEGDYCPEG